MSFSPIPFHLLRYCRNYQLWAKKVNLALIGTLIQSKLLNFVINVGQRIPFHPSLLPLLLFFLPHSLPPSLSFFLTLQFWLHRAETWEDYFCPMKDSSDILVLCNRQSGGLLPGKQITPTCEVGTLGLGLIKSTDPC